MVDEIGHNNGDGENTYLYSKFRNRNDETWKKCLTRLFIMLEFIFIIILIFGLPFVVYFCEMYITSTPSSLTALENAKS